MDFSAFKSFITIFGHAYIKSCCLRNTLSTQTITILINFPFIQNNNYEPSDDSIKDPDYKDDFAWTDASTNKDEPLDRTQTYKQKGKVAKE